MQRFFSTASLSILTAIAIVVYSSDYSTPISKGNVVTPLASPLSNIFEQSGFAMEIDEATMLLQEEYDLEETIDAAERSDLLALAPYQFSSCDVGLLSHSLLPDQ